MKLELQDLLKQILTEMGVSGVTPEVEIPEDAGHGDYSTNIALRLSKQLKKPPFDLALQVAEKLKAKISAAKAGQLHQTTGQPGQIKPGKISADSVLRAINRVEVVKPGFINLWLTEAKLSTELVEVLNETESYGTSQVSSPKKIVIEHTSPNTIKTLHLGHVRNNVLGMAVGRLLEAVGNKVFYDAINNDRGIHVMKANWAYLQYGKRNQTVALRPPRGNWKEILEEWNELAKKSPRLHDAQWRTPKNSKTKGDRFVDQFYVLGVKAEEKFPGVKKEMQEMLRAWEAHDGAVHALWHNIREWVLEGFKETYNRLGSHHDVQWFESDLYEQGKELVQEGIKKGAFRKLPDGAVLTNLKDLGLSDTVVLRADGTALYMTFDPNLTRHKRERYDADLYIWDIGPEQILYLKQMFAVCEKLGIGKRSDYLHLSYGFVYLKGKGKMSSRAGTVVSADDLMDTLHERAGRLIKPEIKLSPEEKEQIAERVGVGALKYNLLRTGRITDIHFDIDESLSLEGDSGPYIQYTYARAKSVLRKSGKALEALGQTGSNYTTVNIEEGALLRLIYQFPEMVAEAAGNLTPNTLCSYLFRLAQAFNLFYAKHSILGIAKSQKFSYFRIKLTAATAQTLKNGLYFLGIATLERM